jgi:hypothetical protein
MIPAEELERIVSTLHALASAVHSNSQQVHPWWTDAAIADVDRFVAICAEHGVEVTVDRGTLNDVMVRLHGGEI